MANVQHLGHMVEPDGGERLAWAGMEFVIRASAESTGGAFSIVEEIDAVDAPPHIHTNEDELFFGRLRAVLPRHHCRPAPG